MNEQEVKKLYQALLSKGYSTQDLGDEQRFLSKMGDANNRKQLYDWVSSKGNFRIGDFNAYEARLTGGAQQEHPSTEGTQDFTMKESELEKGNSQQPTGNRQQATKPAKTQPAKPKAAPITTPNIPSIQQMMDNRPKYQPKPVFEKEVVTDEEGNRVRRPKLQPTFAAGRMQENPVVRDVMGNEYDPTDEAVKNEVRKQTKAIPRTDEEERAQWQMEKNKTNDPSLMQTIGKSIGAGFTRVGAGLVDVLQQLSSNLYVEDASSPTGYTRTQSYEEQLKDKKNPLTQASASLNATAERMSNEAQPYGGQKGFIDLFIDGELGKFVQKGLATAGESLPMTLSWANPYTATLNAISMAGGNYRQETLENPDIPAWKRAAYAVGSAAIEQAVEKYTDPVYKYIKRGLSKEVAQDVVKKATENIAKRIYNALGRLGKDAAGEGGEEIITNFGNDVLGQMLDLANGDKNYGIEAQWQKIKKKNPNADLMDFATAKAKEYGEAFIGGALAGAYTSGTAQATAKALEYATKRIAEEDEPIEPITLEVAQAFDDGYTASGQEMNDAKNMLDFQRQRIGEIAADDMLQQLDEDPVSALDFILTDEEWSDEEKQTAIDYVNAKATYDGMLQRVADDVDGRIAESDRLVSERVSKTDGMIHPAVLKAEGRQVYIVDGNVGMMPDGTMVDMENSDESVIVRDGETGELSFVSPSDILMVDEALDAEEERQTAVQAIRQQFAQQAADEIDGVLRFNPGEQYTVLDDEGQEHTIEVVPNADADAPGAVAEGSVLVSVDGAYVPQVMLKEEVQRMHEAYNLARLAEHEREKAAQRAEEKQYEANGLNGENGSDVIDENNVSNEDAMPMIGEGEDAEPDFMAVTPERAHSYLYNEAGLSRDEANQFVEANKKAADKELEKAKKGKPTMGTSLARYKREQSEYQQKVDAAQQVADYWNAVKSEQDKRDAAAQQAAFEEQTAEPLDRQAMLDEQKTLEAKMAVAKQMYGDYFDSDFTVPYDAMELVAMNMPSEKISWEGREGVRGLQQELGSNHKRSVGRGSTSGFNTYLAKKGEGISTDRAIHDIWESPMNQLPNGEKRWDTEEIRNAFIEMFRNAERPSDIRDYVYNNRVRMAEENRAAEDAARENAEAIERENSEIMRLTGLTPEEYEAWITGVEAQLAAQEGYESNEQFFNTIDNDRQTEGNAGRSGEEGAGEVQGQTGIEAGTAADDTAGAGEGEAGIEVSTVAGGETAMSETKVVDENGRPKVLYHSYDTDNYGSGLIFLSDDKKFSQEFGSNTDEVYVDLRNPYITPDGILRDADGNEVIVQGEPATIGWLDSVPDDYLAWLRENFDGVMSEGDYTFVVAFDKSQVKPVKVASVSAAEGNAPLTHDEAITIIAQMEERAEVAPDIDLTIENWDAQFGEDGRVNTPIGEVKMGENQFTKLMRQGREGKLGMIKPTLETPDVIIEDASEAKEDDVAERSSSYVFVKAFKKADGSRYYYFTSVTVSKDGKEVVISNQEKRKNAIANLLTKGKLVWKHADDVSAASDVEQGLYSSQGKMSDPTTEGTDAPQTNLISDGKGTEKSDNVQEKQGKTYDISPLREQYDKLKGLHPDATIVFRTGDTYTFVADDANDAADILGITLETDSKGTQFAFIPSADLDKTLPMLVRAGKRVALADGIDYANPIQVAEQETDTNPTEAQKKAGNYKKGHVKIDGYDVTIENPKGSVRSGTDAGGKKWEQTMHNTYGYIRGTEGVDGDHIDVFLSDNPEEGDVYVIDQVNKDGSFDEHKVMYGFNSAEEASAAYLSNYEEGWQGLGTITGVTKDEFKKWIESSHRKTKPFAEYKSVKATEGAVPKSEKKEGENAEADTSETVAGGETGIDKQAQTSKPAANAAGTVTKSAEEAAATATEGTAAGKPAATRTRASKVGKIDDFGEKIGGARKDVARGRIRDTKKMTVKDLTTLKKGADDILSQANIMRLYKDGQMDEQTARGFMALNNAAKVAMKHASPTGREIIMTKYRDAAVAWEEGRPFVFEVTDKDIKAYQSQFVGFPEDKARESLDYLITDPYNMFMQTYEAIDYPAVERKLGQYVIVDYTSMKGRHYVPSRPYWVKNGLRAQRGYPFATMESAVADLKKLCPEVTEKEKKARGEKAEHGLHVTKEGYGFYIKSRNIPGNIYLSPKFFTEKEAQKYLDDNLERLKEREQRLVDALMGSNIGMAEREGVDYRNGKDVTPQDFLDEFGFRGVEFGNWVPQGERQMYLNKTYDAIKDFCAIVGISPRAFSLGGRLGLAFGARGKSRAMAHYEPGKEVINLTRMSGVGSLAHEWFHAIDNYLAKQKTGNMSDMATETHDVVREELGNVFKEMFKAMRALDYDKRSRRAGEYWGRTVEEFARLFENYIYNKLAAKETTSPVLVREDVLLDNIGEDLKNSWPYPSAEENAKMEPYFDKLFDTIQEKTDANGNVVLFQKVDGSTIAREADAAEEALRDEVIRLMREAGIEVSTDWEEGQRVLDEANGRASLMAARKNIESGIEALQRIADGEERVPNAMTRDDLSRFGGDNNITFYYGSTGDAERNFKGGYGIAHIGGKHGAETLLHVLNVIATGKIDRYVNGNRTVVLSDGEYEVVLALTRFGNKETWLFNGWKKDEKTGADGEVSTHSDATQANPTFSREDLGAVLSDAKLRKEIEKAKQNDEKLREMRFFRTSNGEAYGFTLNGKIYLDPRIATSETPIHEYAHLWAQALRQANPEAWDKLKEEMRNEQDVMGYVKRLYPEITDEDELLEEVFTHYSGKRGADRLRNDMREEMAKANSILDKARVATIFAKLRDMLSRFWNMARDLFAGRNDNLASMKGEDFADMMMNDLMSGFKPDADASGTVAGARYQFVGEQGAAEADRAEGTVTRIENLATAKQMEADGRPALNVKMATGWERGKDGKWRYETEDDINAADKGIDAVLKEARKEVEELEKKADNLLARINRLDASIPKRITDRYSEEEKAKYTKMREERDQLIKEWSKANRAFRSQEDENRIDGIKTTLGEILGDDYELFKYYPDMKDMSVTLTERLNANGEYEDATIKLKIRYGMASTLLHEIQHAIQHQEGFAKGGNMSSVIDDMEVRQAFIEDLQRDYRYVEDKLSVVQDAKESDEAVASFAEARGMSEEDARAYLDAEEARLKLNRARYNHLFDMLNDDVTSKEKAFEYYKRIAGEVEARNVQERAYMSADERRRSLAAETEDILRGEQIVTYGDAGGSAERLYRMPTFYSNAERAVEGIKQEKATPEQWLAMITKAGGLKAGEDKWMGLSDWLKGEKVKSLTKQEVLDFIRSNQIEIEEVEYAETDEQQDFAQYRQEFKEYYDEAVADGAEEPQDVAWQRMIEEHGEDFSFGFYAVGDELHWDNDSDYVNYEREQNGMPRAINETRLGYTSEGLENKREIALVVPSIESWKEGDEVHFGDAGNGRAIAWVRFGETTDADGKRVLVIDEIQSKRHQEGREKGYKTKESVEEEERLGDAVNKAQDAYDAYTRRMGEKYDGAYEDIYPEMTDAERAEADRLEQEVYSASEKLQNHNIPDIPDAPFDKNWHELAMKRMLRYAAENGYDKIAWTKGEQQAERYNIGYIVDHILSTETASEGEKAVDVLLKSGETLKLLVNSNGTITSSRGIDANGKSLADVVGKELALKILNGDGRDATLWDGNRDIPAKSLEGNDLRVGAEGMKGFYDQILPRFMDKYGKKWGVKTDEIDLPEIGQKMHAVDVTPEMRESVMEGQPMFRDGEWQMSYDESLAASKEAGYTKRQHDALWERRQREKRNTAEDMAAKMHLTDSVTIVESADELDGMGFENLTDEDKQSKGWFDPKTGKIVVILGNHASAHDVLQTMLHEGVNHYGLRELFGKNFNTFLDNVYENATPEIRAEIVSLARNNGWDFRTATEEYLGKLAEDTDFENAEKQGWWQQIKRWFLDMLHKIGLSRLNGREDISDNELRYILWRSYQNLVNPGRYRNLFDVAKDVVMQEKLGVGRFAKPAADAARTVAAEPATGVQSSFGDEFSFEQKDEILKAYQRVKDRYDAVALINTPIGYVLINEDGKLMRNLYSLDRKPFVVIGKEMLDEAMLKLIRKGHKIVIGDISDSGRLHRAGQKALARDTYERLVASGSEQFTEAVQDSMRSLKNLYKAITDAEGNKKHIRDVAGYENAYLAENRMHSASQAQISAWEHDFINPIVQEVYDLAGDDAEAYDALIDYMMAKHGLERNRVLAERDAKAEAAAGNDDYNDLLAKFREKDYAGLTALTKNTDVAAAEATAQQMVDDYEASHYTAELWKKVNAATKSSLEKLFRSGMMSKERYEKIRDMFEYYIPLQGFDETVAEDVYAYMGSDGTRLYGTPIRTAKGRKSKADDPLATIQMNGEAAIRQGNRNEMKQTFLNFVQNHPSDLVSVSDVWLRYNDVTDEWEQYFDAGLRDGDTAADVARKVEAFERRMEQLAQSDPDHYKRGRDLKDVPFRVLTSRDMAQHQVIVRRGGKTYVLTINGNPRAAQALNGMTNPDVFTEGIFGKAMNFGQQANRLLSAIYTTRNPEFVASNYTRDMLYSNCMTWVKEPPSYALKFHKNIGMCNPKTMGKLFVAWENGSLRKSIENGSADEMQRQFYDFMMNGGETGWTSLRDIEQHKKDLEAAIRREGSTSKKAWKAIGGAFDIVNRAVENSARFAAFLTSREMGRSLERSIYDAKEVSVNFNKKGSGDKFLSSQGQTKLGKLGATLGGLGRGLYVFFNAGVQGLANIAGATKEHPYKAAGLMTALYMLGAVMPVIGEIFSGGGDDDDDYYNLPEYVRRSNIVFRFGKDKPWVKIPLPIEFRAMYGLGELACGVIRGKERYSNEELAKQFISQISQVLPLDFMEGGGGWHAFIPSVLKPGVEAYGNTSWIGLPIYRDNKFKPYAPQWTLAYDNTDKTLVAMTRWLNEATGGSDVSQGWIDWNPARIEYMLKGYLGGPFTMYDRFKKTAETAFGEREFEWRNIPVASRFLHEGDERTSARKAKSEYFDLLKEYDETKSHLNGFKKIADSKREDAFEYAKRIDFLYNSKEYRHYQIMDYYKPFLDEYYKMEKNADGEEKRQIQEEEDALRREFIDLIHAVDDKKDVNVDEHIYNMIGRMLGSSFESISKKADNVDKKYEENAPILQKVDSIQKVMK